MWVFLLQLCQLHKNHSLSYNWAGLLCFIALWKLGETHCTFISFRSLIVIVYLYNFQSLSELLTKLDNAVIIGDFDIHVNDLDPLNKVSLIDTLDFVQCVHDPIKWKAFHPQINYLFRSTISEWPLYYPVPEIRSFSWFWWQLYRPTY